MHRSGELRYSGTASVFIGDKARHSFQENTYVAVVTFTDTNDKVVLALPPGKAHGPFSAYATAVLRHAELAVKHGGPLEIELTDEDLR